MVPEELAGLERSLYTTILQIRTHKRSRVHPSTRGIKMNVIAPDHALWVADILPIYAGRETTDNLKTAINSLCKQGHLKFGKTINDTYFEIV